MRARFALARTPVQGDNHVQDQEKHFRHCGERHRAIWMWTEAHLDFARAHGMRRVYPYRVELSGDDQAALKAAKSEVDPLSQ